jgi:hypothetical protein
MCSNTSVSGIRQGAIENANVIGELLADLVDRGLDFTEPRLYILDGCKRLYPSISLLTNWWDFF